MFGSAWINAKEGARAGGMGAAEGLGGFLVELPRVLWKEAKLTNKILWKAMRSKEPSSHGEIWREFFSKDKEKK